MNSWNLHFGIKTLRALRALPPEYIHQSEIHGSTLADEVSVYYNLYRKVVSK